MNQSFWTRGRAIFAVLTALLIVIAIVGRIIPDDLSDGSNSKAPAAEAGSADTPKQAQTALTVPLTEETANFCNTLGVKTVTVKYKGKDITTPYFDAGSTHPTTSDDPKVVLKLWSDGPNVPLTQLSLKGEQRVICTDPGQAAMVMNGLGAGTVNGKTIASLNPWMKFPGSPSVAAIAPQASACATGKAVHDVQTHLDCVSVMSRTAYLLNMFHFDAKPSKATTAWSIHLAGPVVGSIPTYALDSVQYTGYFLRFSFTEKAGNDCLSYGFNVGKAKVNGGDQRLAGFSCAKPQSPPKAPTKPTTTPKSPPKHSTPPKHTVPPRHHTPPVTCKTSSYYGPSYNGTYPHCIKDRNTTPAPDKGKAPGQNSTPSENTDPTTGPGSNQCYYTDAAGALAGTKAPGPGTNIYCYPV